MASVYILFSPILGKFYIGSCNEVTLRLNQHLSSYFPGAFTAKAKDWSVYFQIDNLDYFQSRAIEGHIKKMKSKKYIEDLKRYPDILERLLRNYSPSR